jgi:1,4-dihydroxy-2-naphthoyl-CoA synthase
MSILYEVTDSVATIVLNRPEALNSLDPESLVGAERCLCRRPIEDERRACRPTDGQR